MKKRFGFDRSGRVVRNIEYRNIYGRGKSYRDDVFNVVILKNNLGRHRLGLSIGASKASLSSKRNRIKRLIREVFRLNRAKFKNGPYDIAVSIVKAPAFGINYSNVEARLKKLLIRAKVL